MALYTYCWFIIETIVIQPNGYLNLFYLSFLIHPALLFLGQVFLLFDFLRRWLAHFTRVILRFANCVCFAFSVVEKSDDFRTTQNHNKSQHVISDGFSRKQPLIHKLELLEDDKFYDFEDDEVVLHEHDYDYVEEWLSNFVTYDNMSINYYLSSVQGTSVKSSSDDTDSTKSSLSLSNSDSCLEDSSAIATKSDQFSAYVISSDVRAFTSTREEDSDEFYKVYCDRMRWFDLLSYDRTCGLSTIQNKYICHPSISSSLSKVAEKRLLKSLDNDLELVYVAQACLSWEALLHQYTKVKELAISGPQYCKSYSNVAGNFQNFQVLVERFLEDERCQKKRVLTYIGARLEHKSLLQVPKISGFGQIENEGEEVDVKEVLEAIQRCIPVFGEFVEKDNLKKPWWKFQSSSQVEDPKDLDLLVSLTKTIQKELPTKFKKNGKQNSGEETGDHETLSRWINLKLMSRVLQMSMLSSSQLQWCHQKLLSLQDSKEEKHVLESSKFTLLFPSS